MLFGIEWKNLLTIIYNVILLVKIIPDFRGRGVGFMAASLREYPTISGKDAKKFMIKVEKNQYNMQRVVSLKSPNPIKHGRS
ncbi:hypothetical protein SAMN04490355_104226 [Pelosinus propionicus DSM 13327]|uniref:Uncharacterized protein n=1 Tax=Pelosinus propionicus DSM 13327 TaxID=1123291 RepID=A0A1I4N883_9FIRM|nr:hypothetical protein SAMN04490355_104226 [Pelosinus propionicus DSM 13327]